MSDRSGDARARRRRSPLPYVHAKARAAAAHRSTDAGTDRIVCLVCGKTYRAIRPLHLQRVHGFEGPHPVRDYKAMFGLRVATCEESCDRLRDVQIDRHKRAGRHWTRARLLGEIRRRAGVAHALAHSKAPEALTLAARRAFGRWDAALRASGVDPAEHRFTKVWDRDRLRRAIQRHAREVERVSASWAAKADPELHRAAYRLVGNWDAALRVAGLDPRAHREPKRWSLERVEAWVRTTLAAGGDIRSSAAPSGAVDRARMESGLRWSEYVEGLGIPYPGLHKRLDWTDASVRSAIRARLRQGLALHREAVVRDIGQALIHQARNRFGSWGAALRAAGIDPRRGRLHPTWTREEVITAIQARRRAGKSLRHADVRVEDPRLVKAAQRRFPYSWNRAVAASGVPGSGSRGRGRRSRG